MKAYRLVKTAYAASALDGEGARLFGGRWNSKGTRVAYLSDSPALAALEILVHTRSPEDLADYLLFELTFSAALVETMGTGGLPPDWRELTLSTSTQAIGDRWVEEARSVLLALPSAVVSQQCNFLLNPAHPEISRVEVGEAQPFSFDPRLATRG